MPPTAAASLGRGQLGSTVGAVYTLGYLFGSGPAPTCVSVADSNDDGTVNIADAVGILGHLFSATGPLPAPSGECGLDPTPDALTCESYAPCEAR